MIRQLVRLRDRNQITLPSEVAERLSAKPGSLLELVMDPENDWVELRRAEVVRAGTPQVERELKEAKEDIKEGRFETFDNPEDLVKDIQAKRRALEGNEKQEEHADLGQLFEALRTSIREIEARVPAGRAPRRSQAARSKLSSER